MRPRLLLLSSLVSSAIACYAAPDTVVLHPHINNNLQPGEAGTLLELNDDRHWIRDIVVSDNYLFVAVAWAGLYRMPKYGGDIVAVEEDPNSDYGHVATDGERVYWNHNEFDSNDYVHTEVRSQPVDGGPTATLTEGNIAIASFSAASSFGAAGGYVSWSADSGGDTPGVIERVPAGGGPRQTMLTAADVSMLPYWVADDSGVYFTTVPLGGPSNGACSIEHVSGPGETPQVLAACATSDSYVIGSDAAAVYLESSVGLWSMSKADRSVSRIQVQSDDGYGGSAVAFDESNVYGVDGWRDPTLVRFPKTGGMVTPLGDVTGCLVYGGGQAFIAVDAQYVFLVCGDQNRIDVVPNPAAP